MSVASLPPSLRTKLDRLGRRLRLLRLVRGLSVFLLTIAVGAGLALAADAWLELPPAGRWVLFVAWAGTTAWVGWRWLVRPLRRPVSPAALAAAVEDEYPRLDERLTTAVELDEANHFHGSPAFVQLLVRDAELKSRPVDFVGVARPRSAVRMAFAAGAALALLACPAIVWPDYYVGLGRRLLMPWDRRPAVIPFEIAVTPGTAFTARGRPVSIGVELRALREGVSLPEVCTLILTPADGKPQRLRMPRSGKPHEFAFRIDEVANDFRYRVAAGSIETHEHAVFAVDPVELAGSRTTLTPPAYATTSSAQSVDGPGELSVLEHGRVSVDCHFDRPAESATLVFTGGASRASPRRQAVTLGDDHRSGRVQFAARTSGKVRLELAAEHGVTTTTPDQTLTVIPDRPPEFRRIVGLPSQGDARPNDTLTFDLAVTDDLAVAAIDVEYRVNAGAVQREPIAVSGLGGPVAGGRHSFKLAGKVKDRDRLYVRLRATDNRSVPEVGVGPNAVTYPGDDGWAELHIAADASPIRQQDVLAHRNDIERRLREIIAGIDSATRGASALEESIEANRATAGEQARAVNELNNDQAALSKKLADLTRDAEMAGLAPLAGRMQAVGEQEFAQASQAFRDAAQGSGRMRVGPLKRGESALADARAKLEGLLDENRVLADQRLDEVRLEELAEREQDLADQTKQAATTEDRQQLADEQRRLADELDKMTQGDERLREAIRAAAAEEARRLGEQARKLAEAERELDAKLAAAERQRNIARLAELAKQQQELAVAADRFAKETQSSARTANTEPLDAGPTAKAAEELKGGDADSAEQQQDKAARELDRLADGLQQGVNAAADPREAAKRLSNLQEENKQRLRNRPAERTLALNQQESIRKAVETLKIPDDKPLARRDRQQAGERAAEAGRALTRGDAGDAEFRMGQAKDALDRLVKDLGPSEKARPPEPTAKDRDARAPTGVPTPEQVREAHELASRQRDLREQVRRAVAGDRPDAADQAAADQAQRDMAEKASDLSKSMDNAAEQFADDAGRQGVKKAADSARQGEQSLRGARSADPAAAKQARRRAAEALERAAEQAKEAADPGRRRASPNGKPEAGQSLQDAKGEMDQAQGELGRGEPTKAGQSMNRAADALRNAASKLGRPEKASRPAESIADSGSPPSELPLPRDVQQHVGKKWGELSGELRTRIVQEMKAQYGDDYARVIKLYFEQIAETKDKK